jgi:hypothetical protein
MLASGAIVVTSVPFRLRMLSMDTTSPIVWPSYLSIEMVKRLDRSREHFSRRYNSARGRRVLPSPIGPAAATVKPRPREHLWFLRTELLPGQSRFTYFSSKVVPRVYDHRSLKRVLPLIPKIFPERLDALAPRSSGGHRYPICQLIVRDRDQHHLLSPSTAHLMGLQAPAMRSVHASLDYIATAAVSI